MKTMLFLAYVPREGSCTGSQVRPRKMEQAFCSLGYRVISLWGEPGSASRRAEIRRFSDLIQRESPLFCYAEGPSGPLFYREERKLLHEIAVERGIPTGWFYRDAACFYPEVWAGRPLLDRIKQYPIRFGTREEQRWLEKRVALFFVPTQSFAVDRGLSPFLPLPPGSDALRTGFFPTEPRGKRCIYVGGLSHRYGTDLMLRAFARLNRQGEYPLTVVCRPGETEALRPFRGNSWLTVCHEQERDLAALYEKQDLALYPLRSGAYQQLVFSVKIPEYLANGLPVAAVYSRETAAFLQKWGVGRCCEDREEAFAGLVRDMLENRREYRNMTERIALCVKNNQWKDRARQAADALQPACGKREST